MRRRFRLIHASVLSTIARVSPCSVRGARYPDPGYRRNGRRRSAADRACRGGYASCDRRLQPTTLRVAATWPRHNPGGREKPPFWRPFGALAVDDCGGGAGLASGSLPVDHHGKVMDRPEQEQAYKPSEPPIDCLPGREVYWQHPPAAACPSQVTDCIQDLSKIDAPPPAGSAPLRQQWFDL